jgi:hypothetical protein
LLAFRFSDAILFIPDTLIQHYINYNNKLNLKDPSPKASNPKPSTSSGPNWKHWLNPLNLMDPLTPEARLALSKPSNPKPSTDSDFDWDYWYNLKDPPSSGASLSKSSNPRPSNPMAAHQPLRPLRIGPKVEPPEEPENEVASGPSPTPESTDPELNSDHQSLSADSQLADSQTALYESMQRKAKRSKRARDVGNAAEGLAALKGRLIRGSKFPFSSLTPLPTISNSARGGIVPPYRPVLTRPPQPPIW